MKNMKILLICIISVVLAAVVVTAAAQDGFYTVRQGDTLWSIAKGYGLPLEAIIKANPQIKEPDTIFADDRIYIPNTESVEAAQMEIFELINRQRVNAGLAPLTRNDSLFDIAKIKSEDMVSNQYFAHQSPTLGSPFSMMLDRGITFSAAGECIANGHDNAAQAVSDWMASSGNKSNILSSVYNEVGIGAAKAENGTFYFTALFIKKI